MIFFVNNARHSYDSLTTGTASWGTMSNRREEEGGGGGTIESRVYSTIDVTPTRN